MTAGPIDDRVFFPLEDVLVPWTGRLTVEQLELVRERCAFEAVARRDAGFVLAGLLVGAMDMLAEDHDDPVGQCLGYVAEALARHLVTVSA